MVAVIYAPRERRRAAISSNFDEPGAGAVAANADTVNRYSRLTVARSRGEVSASFNTTSRRSLRASRRARSLRDAESSA
jgi:hypothetical protein